MTCNEGLLTCRIADDGVGIPTKDQPHIFETLYRATNVTQMEGNGFGLYVAKGACEQQGGRLTFESTEGKGTRFLVELPTQKPCSPAVQPGFDKHTCTRGE